MMFDRLRQQVNDQLRSAPLGPMTTPPLDPEQLRAKLARTGHVILPGLCDRAEIKLLVDGLAEVYERHGWLDGRLATGELVPDLSRRDGVPGWWRFAEDVQRLEVFHRLAHDPPLLGVADLLIDGPVLHHSRRHLVIVNPGFWVPPYQDYTHIQGTVDFLTAYVALADDDGEPSLSVQDAAVDPCIRPLAVLPTKGVAAHVAPEEEGTWNDLDLRAGDVVIVHALALRRFRESSRARLRLFPQYRFQSARRPVVKASLKPEHFPRLPDWDVITRGWSSTRWVLPPLLPRLTPFRMPNRLEDWHRVLPAEKSDLLAGAGFEQASR